MVAAIVLASAAFGLGIRYVAEPPSSQVFGGPTAPPAVSSLLASLFSDETCHEPEPSKQAVERGLAGVGLTTWSVRLSSQVKPGDCVTATYDVEHQQVVLLLAMRPEVRRAIDALAADLLVRCLDRTQAESALREALTAVGTTQFELRTDGGEAGPVERQPEVHAHFEAGCWIYSASGWTSDGTPIFVIGGKQ